jgi:AraC-like DNA-binding protein
MFRRTRKPKNTSLDLQTGKKTRLAKRKSWLPILGFASAPGRAHAAPANQSAPLQGVRSALIERRYKSPVQAMDARIASVLESIAGQLEKPQSVKLLAAQQGLSPSRFQHLFKREAGQSFKAYLRALRLSRAKEMLEDRTLRVKEVAAAVGYADMSNFAHDYRKRYGQSPSQSRSRSGRVTRPEARPPRPPIWRQVRGGLAFAA